MTEPAVSFVVIGLNEAPSLPGAIAALQQQGFEREGIEILYVDSGSTDASVAMAEGAGVDRVLMAAGQPRCAALARNTGLAQVRAPFVHFVDGDTCLEAGWTAAALAALESDPSLAGVEGHLREARPEASLLHAVCELDWVEQGAGSVPFVGGNSLYRSEAIRAAGGFAPQMTVGEEPELGHRMRGEGWHFRRLDLPMAQHDLDFRGLGDYWRRAYKGGLSCGLVSRATDGAFWQERSRRTLLQAGAWTAPLAAACALALPAPGAAAAFFGAWAILLSVAIARKSAQMTQRHGKSVSRALGAAYGLHTVASKLPAALGVAAAYRLPLPEKVRDAMNSSGGTADEGGQSATCHGDARGDGAAGERGR